MHELLMKVPGICFKSNFCQSVCIESMGNELVPSPHHTSLLDFSLTVKAVALIFISGRGSAISSAEEGKSGFTYNLVKS